MSSVFRLLCGVALIAFGGAIATPPLAPLPAPVVRVDAPGAGRVPATPPAILEACVKARMRAFRESRYVATVNCLPPPTAAPRPAPVRGLDI